MQIILIPEIKLCFGPMDLAFSPKELELIQSHMARKPVLRGEVGCACLAREVRVERGDTRSTHTHDMRFYTPGVSRLFPASHRPN